jgi:hypothetical protein
MKPSLLAHELGHIAYLLVRGIAPRANVSISGTGATAYHLETATIEQNGYSALTAAVAGFYYELGQSAIASGSKPEVTFGVLQSRELSDYLRLGLNSAHVSDGDKADLQKIDINSEEAVYASRLGFMVAMKLLNNQTLVMASINEIDEMNDLLVSHKDIVDLLQSGSFNPRHGIGTIFNLSGQIIKAEGNSAVELAQSVRALRSMV